MTTRVLISIRAKLGAVFVGFLLLVAGSVAATFVALRAHEADALVINQAGRQRMLTQEITKAVLGIAREPSSDYQVELRQTAYLFDRTLTALLDGGSVPYGNDMVTLPPTTDAAIRTQLEGVARLWDRFRQRVEIVQTAEPESAAFIKAVGEVEALSPVILQEMDQAVRLYEAAAELKHARLRGIQAVFFVSAVGLLLAGYLLTQRTIVNPVSALEAATRRIASGDLESPVEIAPTASSEVRALAHSFKSMCQELAASRLELERWAAELEMRVERRTEQLAALFEISAEISSKLELRRVLELIVEKTRHLAGGEVAVLCLSDPLDGSLTVTATSGLAEAFAAHPQMVIRGFTPGAAYIAEAAILHESCHCPLLRSRFRRSHLVVPLRIRDRVLGMLCVGHREEDRKHAGSSRATVTKVLGTQAMTVDATDHIEAFGPDVVAIADEGAADTALVAHVLRTYPDLPVVCVGLEESVVHLYRSEQVAATSTSLLDVIRGLVAPAPHGESSHRSTDE